MSTACQYLEIVHVNCMLIPGKSACQLHLYTCHCGKSSLGTSKTRHCVSMQCIPGRDMVEA